MVGALGLGRCSGAIVGGNCNNGLHVGGSAVNLNNLVSNANWNIGAAPFLSIMEDLTKPTIFLHLRMLKYI